MPKISYFHPGLLAGWLLGVHWWSLSGWRWLFIVEGIPALVFGIITLYYMTDWPSNARWLPDCEREWLVNQLQTELQAKKNTRDYDIIEAFRDNRMLRLVAVYFLAMLGALSIVYWVPIFLKRVSGFSNPAVTSLLAITALIGIAGTLINGWHSDRTGERRVHAAVPMIVAGLMYGLLIVTRYALLFAISALLVGSGILYAFYPVFWSIPTMILSE